MSAATRSTARNSRDRTVAREISTTMYLLDTNILSQLAKPRPDYGVTRRIHATEKERLFASEMTRYEIRFGAALHPRPEEFWEIAQRKLIPVPVWIPVVGEVSLMTAELDAHLRKLGKPIGLVDTFLAATALTFQLVMVTRNEKHFGRVPGLKIENWFTGSDQG